MNIVFNKFNDAVFGCKYGRLPGGDLPVFSMWGYGCHRTCGTTQLNYKCDIRNVNDACVCQTGWALPGCDTCQEGYYGQNCEECDCDNGTICNDGLNGDGTCTLPPSTVSESSEQSGVEETQGEESDDDSIQEESGESGSNNEQDNEDTEGSMGFKLVVSIVVLCLVVI
eukprot:TRINITY_DN1179_c0_g1_i4.p1 TRINITY_DN1179_c0_g1~~TRINITY_DN1179_c0_g1_i4.p1  ORF type:complete len:169 (-),score=50.43 TRINITY_DN1179_c0_g1_i4:28-534(-)